MEAWPTLSFKRPVASALLPFRRGISCASWATPCTRAWAIRALQHMFVQHGRIKICSYTIQQSIQYVHTPLAHTAGTYRHKPSPSKCNLLIADRLTPAPPSRNVGSARIAASIFARSLCDEYANNCETLSGLCLFRLGGITNTLPSPV